MIGKVFETRWRSRDVLDGWVRQREYEQRDWKNQDDRQEYWVYVYELPATSVSSGIAPERIYHVRAYEPPIYDHNYPNNRLILVIWWTNIIIFQLGIKFEGRLFFGREQTEAWLSPDFPTVHQVQIDQAWRIMEVGAWERERFEQEQRWKEQEREWAREVAGKNRLHKRAELFKKDAFYIRLIFANFADQRTESGRAVG